jgi:drug/metabolite transporter (DMT)-like permease
MAGGKEHERPYSLVMTAVVVVAWYTVNILLLLLNKFLLSSTKFRQPVFLTLCHMMACIVMGLVIHASGWMPLKPLKSRVQFAKVFFLGVIFCGTIVLGNASLKYLPVSFNQAVGSTTPFFTAIFALFLQGTRESFVTYLTLIPM